MIKKMMLLAGMALAAIAFAVPASASALEWTDNGSPVAEEVEEEFAGRISFGNPLPGQTKFGCDVDVGVTVDPEGHATVTTFDITTSTCEGVLGFAGCELIEDSVTGLPATLGIVNTNTVAITSAIVIHNHYGGAACTFTKSTLTAAANTIHLTLQNSGTTLPSSISGAIETHSVDINGTESTQSGVPVFGSITGNGTLSIS